MSRHVTSAIFDSYAEAETAVARLRRAGVSDRDISIIAQHGENTEVQDGRGDTISDGSGHGVAQGLTLGAGLGTLAGIAALVIPGVGPFIAAGALTSTLGVAGASVATGAIAGAATGGLVGALTDYGVNEQDTSYYNERIGRGGVVVTVDLTSAGMDEASVGDILYAGGGHNSSRSRPLDGAMNSTATGSSTMGSATTGASYGAPVHDGVVTRTTTTTVRD